MAPARQVLGYDARMNTMRSKNSATLPQGQAHEAPDSALDSGSGGVLLTINAGSSSLKLAAWQLSQGGIEKTPLLTGQIDGLTHAAPSPHLRLLDGTGKVLEDRVIEAVDLPTEQAEDPQKAYFAQSTLTPATPHLPALRELLKRVEVLLGHPNIRAMMHRVVHGGERFTEPVLVTPEVLAEITALIPLAPLHQPQAVAALGAMSALRPDAVQMACFDTAFHAAQPWVNCTYALPASVRAAGVQSYGFHGLSYESIAAALPDRVGLAADGRVIIAHLGNGASLCALQHRKSVATTMGFSTLDGLIMGTRCGHLDPGVILHLQRALGMSLDEVEHLLYHQSGLLGLSGVSSDMRVLENSAEPAAQRAINAFVQRINREIGALAAVLQGLDVLVFTAGIGENSAALRAQICHAAAWLGVELDEAANLGGTGCITTARSRVAAWVIPTDEAAIMAQHGARLLRRK